MQNNLETAQLSTFSKGDQNKKELKVFAKFSH